MGRLTSRIIPGDWNSVAHAIARLDARLNTDSSPIFSSIALTGLTENALMYADGDGVLTSLAAATNGQLIIGSTGAAPSVTALLGTASEIVVTPGAGSITLSLHAAITGHLHDGHTLQHDAVNSDGGAFSFTTTGLVTFNQSITTPGLTITGDWTWTGEVWNCTDSPKIVDINLDNGFNFKANSRDFFNLDTDDNVIKFGNGTDNQGYEFFGTGIATFDGDVVMDQDLTVDTTTLVVDAANHRVGIGTATDMLAPLNITGDTADIGDRHEGLWMRSKVGAWIVQLNVRGPRLEIGGGASLDTTPAMSVNYNTGRVGIGTTAPDYILDIDAGEIGDNNYDGLRIIDTGWQAISHPMLEFYNSNAQFNGGGPLARIYGEIGSIGQNSKLYFAVADSSKNLQDRMVIDKGGNVGIGTTTPDTKLQVVGTAGFGDDATNQTRISATGDLLFVGSATVFNDIFFPMTSGKLVGANQPSYTTAIAGTIFEYTFAVNDYIDLGANEISHSYKEGSDFEVHCHVITNGLDGTDRHIRYSVEYIIADVDGVIATATLSSLDLLIPANTTDRTHLRFDIGTITGTNYKINATLKIRFTRIALIGGGTAPASDPFATMVGVHIEEDTVGSKTITTK